MNIAYIALGSNQQQPVEQLHQAIHNIACLKNTEVVQISPFYCSKPLGPQDQPDFINAVIKVLTAFSPLDLLHLLQDIEIKQGRVRTRRWGERTLDLDILLYNQEVIKTDELTIPHYDMQQREFVLIPLYDIAPQLVLPNGIKLAELVANWLPHQMECLVDFVESETRALFYEA